MRAVLRDTWRKNGPELVSAFTNGIPDFVTSAAPPELEGIPVFCYHEVSSATFEAHLRFLHANEYSTLTADEFLDALSATSHHRSRSITKRRVVISFDDGLASLHDTVFPLLRQYEARVVAFISPVFHASSLDNVMPPNAPALPTCSWRQIEAMHASGLVDFQSHTFEHRLVRRWPRGAPLSGVSEAACEQHRSPALPMAEDFLRSRQLIEARLGKRVRHLAFPQYYGTSEAIQAGRRSGYDAFYWGVRPWKPINSPGEDFSCVVRLSGEFLPRLPGSGRTSLCSILRDRYATHASRWRRELSDATK